MAHSFSKSPKSKSPMSKSVCVPIVINHWTLEKPEAVAIITAKTFIVNIISEAILEIIYYTHTQMCVYTHVGHTEFATKKWNPIESISANPHRFEWKDYSIAHICSSTKINFNSFHVNNVVCIICTAIQPYITCLHIHFDTSFCIFLADGPTECSTSAKLWYAKLCGECECEWGMWSKKCDL